VATTPAVIVTSTPDSGLGKPVDFTVITQEDGVTAADRQAVSIGDPTTGSRRAGVTAAGALVVDPSATPSLPELQIVDLLTRILGAVEALNLLLTANIAGGSVTTDDIVQAAE